jgi:hypothetical protein
MLTEELREALVFDVVRLYIARTPEVFAPKCCRNKDCWSVYIVTTENGVQSSSLLFEDEENIKIFSSIDEAHRYLEQTLDISIPAFSVISSAVNVRDFGDYKEYRMLANNAAAPIPF